MMEVFWTIGVSAALAANAIMLVFVLALAREIGIIVTRAGPQRPMINQEGLNVGDVVNDPAPLDDAAAVKAPQKLRYSLVVFLSPTCLVCRDLAGSVAALARAYRDDTRVIAAIKPESGPEHDEMISTLKRGGAWVTHDELWFVRFKVLGTPFATLLDGTNTVISRGTVNSLAQLESLFALEVHSQGLTGPSQSKNARPNLVRGAAE